MGSPARPNPKPRAFLSAAAEVLEDCAKRAAEVRGRHLVDVGGHHLLRWMKKLASSHVSRVSN